MNRPGYNPVRRNRNIGTEKSGFGQDNRLKIPWAWADRRIFYERLTDPVVVPCEVGSLRIHVLVEPPSPGFRHACTVDDILRVLAYVPQAHALPIQVIVLRQPKRKERILAPVWGRMVYWSDLGRFTGPAIYLEAQDTSRPFKWSKSLTPDLARELDRLRDDGHTVTSDRRSYQIESTSESIRNTQLFRTLPHEIGHYVHYLESVETPSRTVPEDRDRLEDAYRSKPAQEKEAFAHRYAGEFRAKMESCGAVPFDRITDVPRMKQAGLLPEWFA